MFFSMVISYWLANFYFYPLHGMKQFPKVLGFFAFGMAVYSIIVNKRIFGFANSIGYILGMYLGNIFCTYDIDPGGGKLSNYWLIWLGVYIFILILAFIFTRIIKRKEGYR